MPSLAEENQAETVVVGDLQSPPVTKNLLHRTKGHSESATSEQNILVDELSGSEISEAKDGGTSFIQ